MSIGSELRQAREQRGVSLREISERTQIRVQALRAIENDDFHRVPGSVVTRGFLKLYAREVGLDADEIARRYAAEYAPADAGGTSAGVEAREEPGPRTEAGSGVPVVRVGAMAVLVVLGFIGVGYLVTRPAGTVPPPTPGEPVVTPTAAPAPPAAPSPPPSSVPPATAPASAELPLRVTLQATDACWVAATADGQQVAFRVLSPGERLEFRVTSEAVLRIGMPGNLAITINDRTVRPFARPASPATLRITPANYRELLGQ